MATINNTVKVQDYEGSNKFQINGLRQKIVVANAGDTIVFDQSDSSNTGHPLVIALYADGHHNTGGNEYTIGVTKTGTPGQTGANTTFVVTNLDYARYIDLNQQLLDYYNAASDWNYGDGVVAANSRSKAEFGESHWHGHGINEPSRVAPPNNPLNGTYYYYCQNHAGMGGMIHFGADTDINGETIYPIIDEGAIAYDAQDNNENLTSNINKTVEKEDDFVVDQWHNNGEYYGNSVTPHTNPWKILNTDTQKAGRYRVTYNVTDSGGLSASPRTKIFNIGDTPPTLAQLLIGNTFWLVNGLDENGKGYTAQDGYGDPTFWESYKYGFAICDPAGGVGVEGSRSAGTSIQGRPTKWTEPNHCRFPPLDQNYIRGPNHWRGQVTFLDETNYIGWTKDEDAKAGSVAQKTSGTYTFDDTGIQFDMYCVDGVRPFKIKLTSEDQLQDGAITRCDDFKRIVYGTTMSMISAIKCGEGDVMPTEDMKTEPRWASGYSDLQWFP